ncbi:DoxX family membrane protein [Amycolatopsis cihanbeyliensis]|uniref:Putative membrane protein YkgB n=1 Tax=Amycolatopsis cihanbeyliensis TaxID=1128664 RepID=A0A542DHX4_AMYCI|nr:DoxX family membrane protein [Amycolatopsis cihanbeyliensis]TQJ02682.1 putative membrane protein YkgB [Amycolatopsis cihanbeyliensis]
MRTAYYLNQVDKWVVRRAANSGISLLRILLGVIFLWFGLPKFVPGLSPAEDLAIRTMDMLSLHLVPSGVAYFLLALLETALGIGLIVGRWLRLTLVLLLAHLVGTMAPLVLLPDRTWSAPLVASLEGQYILKNLVLIAAGIVIAATLRGGDGDRGSVTRVAEPGLRMDVKL